MTDVRLTQSGTYGLLEGEPKNRVTQSAIYVLGGEELEVPAQITQSATYALTEEDAGSLITQSATYALAAITVGCLSYYTQLWKIVRKDGIIHTFTAHDKPVIFAGETYSPCGSIDPSAYASSGNMGDIGNASLTGILAINSGEAGIPKRDIAAGLLDGADVFIWESPVIQDGTIPIPILRGIIGKITLNDITYQAEIVTLSSIMADTGILETYTPTCRFVLGDSRCGVDLSGFTETSEVDGVVKNNARTLSAKRQFIDSLRTEADHWWANGRLTWTSGNNIGFSSEVSDSLATGYIALWEAAPYPIEVGDEYTIVAGCDKTRPTCIAKFNNIDNFGGFPYLPGNDTILQTPDAKE